MACILTSHAEKTQYVSSYFAGEVTRPLMIVGNGGNGKTTIINNIRRVDSTIVYANMTNEFSRDIIKRCLCDDNSNRMVIEALGTEEDYEFANDIQAVICKFEVDPVYY
jgi:predicted ATP-binding protein involved in virulence